MISLNEDIRILCRRRRVPLWALARAEGISEFTLIRRLRVELPDGEKTRMIGIIERIAREVNQ